MLSEIVKIQSGHHHHYHSVEMKKVGDQDLPFLNGAMLLPSTHVECIMPDGHRQKGYVFLDTTCCKNESKPFIMFPYHGKTPWIYLVGMKTRRL